MVLGELGPGQLGPGAQLSALKKVDSWTPDSLALEQCINSTDICSQNFGSIYPIQIYIDIYRYVYYKMYIP